MVGLSLYSDRERVLDIIARPSINQDIKYRKTMGGTRYFQGRIYVVGWGV